ncbi:MAG TPA: hypothetical protein VNU97_12050 [Rhizomicrobium sp.]|nr:hypothetical protein [Rhizomicrobium sp.]
MLTHKAVHDVMRDVLKRVLPKTDVSKIEVQDYADAAGESALEITIVLSKGNVVALNGNELAKVLEGIHSALSQQGDERFPYLRYLTAKEAKQLAL